ncbi:hypothetical protein LAZ67_9001809 [Cordylochernes scorpioides]|uniref:Uncharacterized protein n=1 Tax=Cordylochernes scorpioides TaxID=51811 RepID=A0ABY6KTB0_9ARAC|nr:hypothetical protein LAZ67_9001809 [Cordylochernes scorpioides]
MPAHRKRRQFKQPDAFTRGMVIGLKGAGWSIRQIAADTHLGASTVHRLWRRWLEQGNVAIYRNVGATRVTSARVDRRILRQAVAAPQATCTAILQHVQDTLDHSISTRTISRRLVANGLHSCRPLRRLPLTPPNRRQRLEWCRARSTWMTEWHRVVFSDESRFCLSSDSRRVRVWRRRGERSNPAAIVERPTVRQRGIMVWGAIAYDSRSPLLRIQGTMTAQRYVDDVLRPVTLPYLQGVPNALYQQDNARPHTARISQQALQDVQMLPWPPYSPDLSPIEHVWDIIGRRLHALPQPRSEDELWQMVEREWRSIPQDAIRTLIDSLPRRVAACIAVRDCSCVIAMLLTIFGIETNPGPKTTPKQTTTVTTSEKEIKEMLVTISEKFEGWIERIETRLALIERGVGNMEKQLQSLERTLASTTKITVENSKKIADLGEQIEQLERKSREKQMILYGVPRQENKECLTVVKGIIKDKMKNIEELNITQYHRFSKKQDAPILIEVPDYKERLCLFKNAFALRESRISLSRDYSAKIRSQRRLLNSKRKELQLKGIRAKLRDDRLLVNGSISKVLNGQVVDPNARRVGPDLLANISRDQIAAAIHRLPNGRARYGTDYPASLSKPLKISSPKFFGKSSRLLNSRGALPSSSRPSKVILLPKVHGCPGLQAFRSISLPTTDYRVLSGVLMARLRRHLPDLVPDCQTYAVPGRHDTPLAVISLDLKSAFDTSYLFALLEKLGLPSTFLGWIAVLYGEADGSIRVGDVYIPLLNGVGPLLRRLERTLGRGNVVAYADDIVLFIRDDAQFELVPLIFEEFRISSGVAVNFTKSSGLWCGSRKHRTDSPLGISRTSESLTVLGCTITTRNTVASQASHLMGLLEQAIARWSPFTRGLSLVGRARATNSLVLGSILHHLHGYIPPETTFGRLQTRLARFVWGTSRVSWLPGRILARPVSDGGVGLLEIACQLRLACLKGVQASLRGAANGYSWPVRSRAWLTPPGS